MRTGSKIYLITVNIIKEAVKLNLEHADRGDIQNSYYTSGKVKGYMDILKSMGHKIKAIPGSDENGCVRIRYMEIDGIVIVRENKLDINGYVELMEK